MRGLILAAENVLIDATAWRRWLFQLLTRLGVSTRYDLLFSVWESDIAPLVRRGELSLEMALQRFFCALGLPVAQAREVELAARSKRRQLLLHPRPLPGVERALARLCDGQVTLAVAALDRQSEFDLPLLLRQTGLKTYFTEVYDWTQSMEWSVAVGRMGLRSSSIGMVGLESWQLRAARSNGLQSIRLGAPSDHSDFSVEYLDRLPALLGLA